MYEIQLFGRLEVRTRGVRLSGDDLGGAEPQQILALLALHGALRKDELVELLWNGRPPAAHEDTMEGHLSLLRQRLDPDAAAHDSIITTAGGGYALVAEQVRVDVARFEELVAAASGRSSRRALRPLTAAAHVAARPLLEDVEQPGWAADARERYRVRVMSALLEAAGHAAAIGDAQTAHSLAAQALGLDPASEQAQAIMDKAAASLAPAEPGETRHGHALIPR
ncbi:winged helix-turn-helix domain-containing protein [Actinoplanes sp. NPDC051859]|uniref:AfsR/SARP family transcriptional regulator n=1 Tax=Actinoplanes sp. NPDC051859 TaxID=3363909 RepID=UPI0037A7884A